ncbi:hypothetical protein ABPG74_003530 [Tetrahymena malaccensis]
MDKQKSNIQQHISKNPFKETNDLKYGSLIYIELQDQSDLEDKEKFLCSDGFVIKYIFAHSIKHSSIDFSNGLFVVMPAYNQDLLNKLSELNLNKLKLKNVQGDSDALISFIENLEYEIRLELEKFNKLKGSSIFYGQPFMLQHQLSSRYLSFKPVSQHIFYQENTLSVEVKDIPSENSQFYIQPAHQYQSEISKKINYGDEIILKCNFDEKQASLFWSQSIADDDQSQTSEQSLDNMQYKQKIHDVIMSYEHSTIIKFQRFTDSQTQREKYIFYSDIVWLYQYEIDGYLTYECLFDDFEQFYIKNIMDRLETPEKLQKNYSLMNLRAEKTPQEEGNSIFFEKAYDTFQKSTLGLWKIEHVGKNKGGILGFDDKIRLRTLRNGKYLAVMPIGKDIIKKQQFSVMKEEEFIVTLQRDPNEWTEFGLEYKGKTKEIAPTYINFFNLRSIKTGKYIKSIFAHELDEENRHGYPSIRSENNQSDVFRFFKASDMEVWETHFLRSCLPIIQCNAKFLKKANEAVKANGEQLSTLDSASKTSLLILKKCLQEIKIFCTSDSNFNNSDLRQSAIQSKNILNNPVSFRQRLLKEQGFIKLLTNILEELFIKTESELRNIYQSKQEKGTKLQKKQNTLTIDGILSRPSVLNQKSSDGSKLQAQEANIIKNKKLFKELCQLCYSCITLICKDNHINQQEAYKYFNIYASHIGLEFGAERCMRYILNGNEQLLLQLHKDTVESHCDENNPNHPHFSQFNQLPQLIKDKDNGSFSPTKTLPRILQLALNRGKSTRSNKNHRFSMIKQLSSKKVNMPINSLVSQKTIVHYFMEKYSVIGLMTENKYYFTEMLNFLNTITKSNKSGITINQMLISNLVEKCKDERTEREQFIIPIELHDQGELFLQIYGERGFQYKELSEVLVDYDLKKDAQFIQFLKNQINLYSNLCYGRNYYAKRMLKELFPTSSLLKYILSYQNQESINCQNEKQLKQARSFGNISVDNMELVNCLIAEFINLLLRLHIDSKPRNQRSCPNLVYKTQFITLQSSSDDNMKDFCKNYAMVNSIQNEIQSQKDKSFKLKQNTSTKNVIQIFPQLNNTIDQLNQLDNSKLISINNNTFLNNETPQNILKSLSIKENDKEDLKDSIKKQNTHIEMTDFSNYLQKAAFNLKDDILNEEDSVSPEEMKQIKQYLIDYFQKIELKQFRKQGLNTLLYSNIKILRKLLSFEVFKIERKMNSLNQKSRFGFDIFNKLKNNFSNSEKVIDVDAIKKSISKDFSNDIKNQNEKLSSDFNQLVGQLMNILEFSIQSNLTIKQSKKKDSYKAQQKDRNGEYIINVMQTLFEEVKEKKKKRDLYRNKYSNFQQINNQYITQMQLNRLKQNLLSLKQNKKNVDINVNNNQEDQDNEEIIHEDLENELEDDQYQFQEKNIEIKIRKEIVKFLLQYFSFDQEKYLQNILNAMINQQQSSKKIEEFVLQQFPRLSLEDYLQSSNNKSGQNDFEKQITMQENSNTNSDKEERMQKPWIVMILTQILETNDYTHSFYCLKLLHYHLNQKQIISKSLRKVLLISNEQDAMAYELLKKFGNNLKLFSDTSEIWLHSPEEFNKIDYEYYYMGQEYIKTVHCLTNLLDEEVSFEEIDASFQFKKPSLYRQMMMEKLQIHETLIVFLKTNFFYIENNKGFIEQKDINTPRDDQDNFKLKNDYFLAIFSLTFRLLRLFCQDNLKGKKSLFKHINTLLQYVFQIEVGQLPLIVEIYKENTKNLQKLNQQFVDALVQKIVQGNYHPKYVIYMISLVNTEEAHLKKKILEIILNSFKEYQKNLQAALCMREKLEIVENEEASDGFVDTQMKNTVDNELDLKIDINKRKYPYLYHSKLFELFNIILEEIPGKSQFLKNLLRKDLHFEYLWKIVKKKDDFTENTKPKLKLHLNTFLKCQIMRLMQNLYFGGYDKSNYNKIENFRFFVEREQSKLANYIQRKKKQGRFGQDSQFKVIKAENKKQKKLKENSDDFSDEQIVSKYSQIIKDYDFNMKTYIGYVLEDLIPFLFNACNNHTEQKEKDSKIYQLLNNLLELIFDLDWETLENIPNIQSIILRLYKISNNFNGFSILQEMNPEDPQDPLLQPKRDFQQLISIFHQEQLQPDQKYFRQRIQKIMEESSFQKFQSGISQKSQNILQITPLSNILNLRRSSNDNQERKALLNLIISEKLEQSIKQERQDFIEFLKNLDKYPEYFQNKKKPSQEMIWKFCSFIIDGSQKCLQYIDQNFESHLEYEEKNLKIIIEYIKLCKDILQSISDDTEKTKMQNMINKQSLIVSSIMELICSKNFKLVDSQHKLFFFVIIDFFNQLLDGGNGEVQQSFYVFFSQNASSSKFFLLINEIIKLEILDTIQVNEDYLKTIQKAFKNIKYCYTRKSRFFSVKTIFRFLQLLCENHNTSLQLWLRHQKNSRQNVDILKLILQYLSAVLKKKYSYQNTLNVNRKNISTIIQCFDTLIEMIQGPCYENQIALTEENFIELVYDILSMDDRVSQNDIENINQDEEELLQQSIKYNSQNNFNILNQIQQTQQFFYKLQQMEKKQIEKELVQFLNELSDTFASKFTKSFKMHQDFETWMVSRVKFKCFQTIESMLEGNTNNIILKKMMSIIPIEYLKLNLLQVYSNFKVEHKCQYNMELFDESLTHKITELEPEDIKTQKITVIESGFKIFNLISKYEQEYLNSGELNQDEEDDEDTFIKDVFGTQREFFKPIFRGIKRLFLQNILRENETSFRRNVELSQELNQQALDFFKKYVCRIEILREEKLYPVYFPKLPYCEYLTDTTKDQFQEKVNRMSINSKLRDLMQYSDDILDQLQNEYSMMKQYEKLFIFIYVAKNFEFFQNISFYLALTQNILILITVQDHSFSIDSGVTDGSNQISNQILFACQIAQVALGGMLAVFFTFKVIMLKFKKAQKHLKETETIRAQQNWLQVYIYKLYIYSKFIFIDFYIIYYLCQSTLAILGIFNPIFSVVLLVDIFRKLPSAKSVIQSLLKTWQQLLVILFIWIILTYCFALIYYYNYYDEYQPCTTLANCTFMILDLTFKVNAGFLGNDLGQYSSSSWSPSIKILIDFLYAFVITVLILQIIQGLIIDTFALIREEQEQRVREMETYCFICGRDRESLDKQGENAFQGFDFHVKNQHNQWCYIFYIAYIQNKPPTECTGLESYVRWCVSNEETKIQWFPVSRANIEGSHMGIQNDEKDKMLEKKLEKISNQITIINNKLENINA